jgi:acyl-homoserine lactone acylase PvdQ
MTLLASGKPLLANDPHLPISIPLIWQENHLTVVPIISPGREREAKRGQDREQQAEEMDVIGVANPGLPLVLIGHNAHSAWGVTLAYTDADDVFLERFVDWEQGVYELNGKPTQAQLLEEEIKIKGCPSERLVVRLTAHGPVLPRGSEAAHALDKVSAQLALRTVFQHSSPTQSCAHSSNPHINTKTADITITDRQSTPVYALAFAAASQAGFAQLPGLDHVGGMYRLNKMKSFADLRQAVEKVAGIGLNVGYCDVKGHVGYHVTGRVPLRKCPEGREMLPMCGWDGSLQLCRPFLTPDRPHTLIRSCDYLGFSRAQDMPHALNPSQGLLLSANAKIVAESASFRLACQRCGRLMAVADVREGPYAQGWRCDNGHMSTETFGERWVCVPCGSDVCLGCVPLDGGKALSQNISRGSITGTEKVQEQNTKVPVYLGNSFKSGYRAQAIAEGLAHLARTHHKRLDVSHMQALQLDTRSVAAERFASLVCAVLESPDIAVPKQQPVITALPAQLARDKARERANAPEQETKLARPPVEAVPGAKRDAPDDDSEVRVALRLLRGWDGQMAAASAPAAVYSLMHWCLVRVLLISGLFQPTDPQNPPPTPATHIAQPSSTLPTSLPLSESLQNSPPPSPRALQQPLLRSSSWAKDGPGGGTSSEADLDDELEPAKRTYPTNNSTILGTIGAGSAGAQLRAWGLQDEEFLCFLKGGGLVPGLKDMSELAGWVHANVIRMLEAKEDGYWLRAAGGRRYALRFAAKRAVRALTARFTADPSAWRWGALHKAKFQHLLSATGMDGGVLRAPEQEVGGDTNTIAQATFADTLPPSGTPADDDDAPEADAAPNLPLVADALSSPSGELPSTHEHAHKSLRDPGKALGGPSAALWPSFDVTSTASWRWVVDLSDWDSCVSVLPVGNSGRPLSPHFADQTDLWGQGKYKPLPFTKPAVLKLTKHTLLVSPGKSNLPVFESRLWRWGPGLVLIVSTIIIIIIAGG